MVTAAAGLNAGLSQECMNPLTPSLANGLANAYLRLAKAYEGLRRLAKACYEACECLRRFASWTIANILFAIYHIVRDWGTFHNYGNIYVSYTVTYT